MSSEVYFATAGGRLKQGATEKLKMLFREAGFTEVVGERDLVAVKVHFGEKGGTAFVQPTLVRPIVESVVECGGRPFLTDTCCLYLSRRSNACGHLWVAHEHGFGPETALAPVIIADGLRGTDVRTVCVDLRHYREVQVASAIQEADSLIVVSHVTGHALTGLAGSIKNLGMGAGSRRMKMDVHEMVRPAVREDRCDLCLGCLERCPTGAISEAGGEIVVDRSVCYGCGECLAVCPSRAIKLEWRGDPGVAQEKLAEITFAALAGKKERAGFFSFVVNVTPTCDCWDFSAPSFVQDIGYLASKDPVAIDQAAADLVNGVDIIGRPMDREIDPRTPDKFRALFGLDWYRQLEYGEEIGLGTRDYDLVRVGD